MRIRPRFLVPVSNRDMSVEIFGDRVKIPFGISPTAMQKMAHADGECANARGSKNNNYIRINSKYIDNMYF